MKKLNKKEAIAVFVSLAFLVYLLYGGTIVNSFRNNTNTMSNNTNSATGVEVQDPVVGTGTPATRGDTVVVHYVGTLTDGKVFDSSVERGVPFTFVLGAGSVIRGWDEGLVGMRVGGKRRLVIAPDYAYGDRAIGTIPANSTLVFDVELLNVQKPAQ